MHKNAIKSNKAKIKNVATWHLDSGGPSGRLDRKREALEQIAGCQAGVERNLNAARRIQSALFCPDGVLC